MSHIPVMSREVVEYLLHDQTRRVIDATVGAGGHAAAILRASERVHLLGIDRDPQALAEAEGALGHFEGRFELMIGNYADLVDIHGTGEDVDGVLLDLGVSSLQIDRGERGFSYAQDGPLDMRMSGGGVTARDLLAKNDERELAKILRMYGDVDNPLRIARGIRSAVERDEMKTTGDLTKAVNSTLRGTASPGLLSRVFQAIRIAVNDELTNLDRFLSEVLGVLARNARLVIISYHSLEDRRVKDFIRHESRDCICPPQTPVCACGHQASLQALTRRAVKPSQAEIESNSRARSARLRAARAIV